jgi:hypothetical protein
MQFSRSGFAFTPACGSKEERMSELPERPEPEGSGYPEATTRTEVDSLRE